MKTSENVKMFFGFFLCSTNKVERGGFLTCRSCDWRSSLIWTKNVYEKTKQKSVPKIFCSNSLLFPIYFFNRIQAKIINNIPIAVRIRCFQVVFGTTLQLFGFRVRRSRLWRNWSWLWRSSRNGCSTSNDGHHKQCKLKLNKKNSIWNREINPWNLFSFFVSMKHCIQSTSEMLSITRLKLTTLIEAISNKLFFLFKNS